MTRVNGPTIEIYSMMNCADGSSTIHEGPSDPDFYDVIVRYPGDDPLEEAEDLKTWKEVWAAVSAFQLKYWGSHIEEIKT